MGWGHHIVKRMIKKRMLLHWHESLLLNYLFVNAVGLSPIAFSNLWSVSATKVSHQTNTDTPPKAHTLYISLRVCLHHLVIIISPLNNLIYEGNPLLIASPWIICYITVWFQTHRLTECLTHSFHTNSDNDNNFPFPLITVVTPQQHGACSLTAPHSHFVWFSL